jgi:CTP:phosphocholine cytidylyltransferase-like protein
MQPASTQSIILLTDFYYLVINYNYVLTYNKHWKQYNYLTSSVHTAQFQYMQSLCSSPFYAKLSCKAQFSTNVHVSIKFTKLVDPKMKLASFKCLNLRGVIYLDILI